MIPSRINAGKLDYPSCKNLLEVFGGNCQNCPRGTEDRLSEEDKTVATELLERLDLLKYVKTAMEERDVDQAIIGEDHSSLTLFLNCVGALNNILTQNTLKGSSSVGKTAIANMVTGFFKTKKVGDLSVTALKYSDEEDYDILYLQEAMEKDIENRNIRLTSSDDGGFMAEVTINNPKTGEFETQKTETPAKTFVTTSTVVDVYDEFSTRSFLIPLDESKDQTKRIVGYNFNKSERLMEKFAGRKFGEKYQNIKNALTLLEEYVVIIPYDKELINIFTHDNERSRRDSKKLLQLIECSAFLFQRQRLKIEVDDYKILLANPQDLINVVKIAMPVLKSTVTGFDSRTFKVMELLPEIWEKDGYIATANVTIRVDISRDYVAKILKQLRNMNLIYIDDSLRVYFGLHPNANAHKLSDDYEKLCSIGISGFTELDISKIENSYLEFLDRFRITNENHTVPKPNTKIIDPLTGESIQFRQFSGTTSEVVKSVSADSASNGIGKSGTPELQNVRK